MKNNAVLEFKDYSLSIEGKAILSSIELIISQGESISVVGQNGAGKSSLLKSILGIFRGQGGDILLRGKSLRSYSQTEIARLVAYVPQNGVGVFPQSVYEFIMLGRYARMGMFKNVSLSDEVAVSRAMELTGTSDFKQRRVASLSGGERQRVVIAAALAQEPEILLLDEVSHFLDPKHEEEVQRLLGSINKDSGVTLLSVTHDINRAALNSSRVVGLKEGKIVFQGLPQDFMNGDILRSVYEKSFSLIQHPSRQVYITVPGE